MHDSLFPIFLDLRQRPVLVVGAGTVAGQKLPALLLAGAAVTVVAPQATPEIERLASSGQLSWRRRRFLGRDLNRVWLVVAATADRGVNAQVARAALARRIFVNAVDDPDSATAYAGAIVRRGPVTAAISSGGRAPALSRLLRESLEQLLPDAATLSSWATQSAELRADWRARALPLGDRYAELLRVLLERTGAAKAAVSAVQR
jgi:uroporphyrin-III C-methyltransferase/precorrin-2 dehydrogenase/sirohydrochlorin ferrochelatase